jgi:predicted choloylglycine hydrolase
MKKQFIIATALFISLSAQASEPSMYERMKAAAREKYEAAKTAAQEAAQSGYTTAKGLVQQYVPDMYERAKGFAQQYVPTVQEFASNFAKTHVVPKGQKALENLLMYNTTIDDLIKGVPFGSAVVDHIRTMYMSKYYPNLIKKVSTDENGDTIIRWTDEK